MDIRYSFFLLLGLFIDDSVLIFLIAEMDYWGIERYSYDHSCQNRRAWGWWSICSSGPDQLRRLFSQKNQEQWCKCRGFVFPYEALVRDLMLIWVYVASAWVTLENVRVPVENLIGAKNKGFITLMASMSIVRIATLKVKDLLISTDTRARFQQRTILDCGGNEPKGSYLSLCRHLLRP